MLNSFRIGTEGKCRLPFARGCEKRKMESCTKNTALFMHFVLNRDAAVNHIYLFAGFWL